MTDDIANALAECIAARQAAAAPLKFSAEAAAEANQRSESQFRANLPLIPGGFAAARTNLLRAATLFGAISKAIALFHDPAATEITRDQMASARAVMERECRFKVAAVARKAPDAVGVAEGLVCNG